MAEYVTGSGDVVRYDDGVALPGVLSVNAKGYVRVTQVVKGTTVLFHRWLTDTVGRGHEVIVEHDNGDQLDCRRANLKVVTPSQHQLGRPTERDLPLGVYASSPGRYKASLYRNGVYRHLGTYDSPEAAAAARARLLD